VDVDGISKPSSSALSSSAETPPEICDTNIFAIAALKSIRCPSKSRETHGHAAVSLMLSGESGGFETVWRREVDSNPRYREGFYGRELGASQREEAPDLFWPSPAVMISAIGSCKPLIPSRQPNRSRSRARRRSLKTHVAHSVRVGSPVRFRGLGNHQSILFVGVVMSGAGPDA
jgi:hypothetical protein